MQEVMAHLDQRGIEYKNFGTFTKDSCDYPEYAKLVANAVVDGTCEKGILICGTGIGISIAANKVPGIRCALCHDCFSAKATREHNNANVLAMGGKTGTDLFKALLAASGAISTQYGNGSIFWAMNRKTHMKLLAESIGVNANGTIVAGMNNTMPVIGGTIEILDWMPDDVLIGGADDLYLLIERAGATIARSEHVQFVQDNTVFQGTARYDGIPVIAEGFVALSLSTTKPTAAAVTFTADKANAA
jgi:RpiB/LacA/LacB family sugar-phosphate isomerase